MKITDFKHAGLMQALSDKHQVLLDIIGYKPLHYVDIPVHGNIGDLLIMQGTLAFFDKYGLVPKVSAPAFAYDQQWIEPGDVIVFHGGGNFGDLYSEYGMQPLREQVVSNNLGSRIIVLPQTIHFSSPEKQLRSARLFRTHPDVHICVRDQNSYEIAQAFSDHVYLLPDMAHQLYPVNAEVVTGMAGSLLIKRTDDEKSIQQDTARFGTVTMTDWPQLVGQREWHIDRFRRAMHVMHKLGMGWLGNRLLADLWAGYANKLVSNAIRLFSSYELIVTDRLHGHILACLMDKPSIVLDNSYGKNSRYVSAWTLDSDLVSLQQA
ncbi:MAG TPA: polysaccharide pyruvyl transferase family protein [Methylophilaceae bacterium]|jgi:pyruvyl transferase EpsO